MAINQNPEIDILFKALSSHTRRNIILQLIQQDLTIQKIANKNHISKQAASKQKKILAKSGILKENKSGREKYCTINPEALIKIKHYIEHMEYFWDNKLRNLKIIIED